MGRREEPQPFAGDVGDGDFGAGGDAEHAAFGEAVSYWDAWGVDWDIVTTSCLYTYLKCPKSLKRSI